MNEENQNKSTPEKTGLDEKRKTALLRYVAILFAVAFVFVLISMLAQNRNSMSTITQLNQSSTSALQKAELLQESNQALELENADLKHQMEDLQQQLDAFQEEADETFAEAETAWEEQNAMILKDLDLERETSEKTKTAYELLLKLQSVITSGDQSGNPQAQAILKELEEYKEFLGENALKFIENLEKGE